MVKHLEGTYSVLITPFDQKGELDEQGFRENIRFQLDHEVDGLVALGTTGEAPSLTQQEKRRVIEIVVQEAKDKVPIVIGTGSYSTKRTIEDTLIAQELGADMALIVTPYYNKPTQEGIYRHFLEITKYTSLPIVIYNVPVRCIVNIQNQTLLRLSSLPRIIGVKEASGSIQQISDVIEMMQKERPDFSVLSGDDGLTYSLMTLGGHGILSVISNLVPSRVKAMTDLLLKGDFYKAREIHFELMPLVRAAFVETNPIPIKTMMRLSQMPAGHCRLPLSDLQKENEEKIEELLKSLPIPIGLSRW